MRNSDRQYHRVRDSYVIVVQVKLLRRTPCSLAEAPSNQVTVLFISDDVDAHHVDPLLIHIALIEILELSTHCAYKSCLKLPKYCPKSQDLFARIALPDLREWRDYADTRMFFALFTTYSTCQKVIFLFLKPVCFNLTYKSL